jgi:quercetin dioxygenase-like cupin family protein
VPHATYRNHRGHAEAIENIFDTFTVTTPKPSFDEVGQHMRVGASADHFGGTRCVEQPTVAVANAVHENQVILLDESNLGGKELELAELSLKAGATVAAHKRQSLEVIYDLSGTLGHEVNGHYYPLKPGMVGVVRPGDHVRHLVPKEHDARVLLIWPPAGEAKRITDYATGTPIKAPSESERPQ